MALADFFKKKQSSSVAKDRLKFVLASDRAGCSPEVMEKIKNDIIAVISKYIEIDMDGLDINISQNPDSEIGSDGPVLFANIPIKDMRSKK
ncbi:MAG: cell division topological specificity factor MinE [Lachnospiraceae bacterium]|nr:cell division topological specificity factor MinE [Lachnospiraceae bacterium]MBP3609090.1 cell division topological specificity factor MinE [Lachnospiraceae bacterium]